MAVANPYVCERRKTADPGESEVKESPFSDAFGRLSEGLDGPVGAVAGVVGFVLTVVFLPFDLLFRLAGFVGIPLVLAIQTLFPIAKSVAEFARLDPVVVASVTLLVGLRLVLLPFACVAVRSSVKLQLAAPRMRDLQRTHAHDREALNRAMMQFYREADIRPFGCIWPLLPSLLLIVAFYGAIELLVTRSSTGTFDPVHVAEASDLARHMGSLELFVSWQMDLTASIGQVGTCAALAPYAALIGALLIVTAYSVSTFAGPQIGSRAAVVAFLVVGTVVFAIALPAFVVLLRVADSVFLIGQGRWLRRYRRGYASRLAHDPDFHRLLADAVTDAAAVLRRD